MTSAELVTMQAASSTVAAVVNAANNVFNQIKAHGTANDAQRKLLSARLAEAHTFELQEGTMALHRQKFAHMRELFDEASAYEGTPRYVYLFQTAIDASVMLEDNIRLYVRRAR